MSIYHWIWLTQQVPGPAHCNRLLEVFQKPERIYSATMEQLLASNVLSREQCAKLVAARSFEPALSVMNRCAELGIRILTIHDALYPERLRNISNPPILLYIRGSLPLFDDLLCVALVGTRHASPVSLRNADNFAYALGRRGICHISGMADGIDSAGHNGALRAGAMSVAVFGCGADVCYPAGNRRLMDRLEQNGCIISEYPPGTTPTRASFPQRNRIIAGLANGVLIFAAPKRSGSIITANLATEFGRDVFVVPGGIGDPEYAGANELIKDGAIPITSPDDIFHFYNDSAVFTAKFSDRIPQSDYETTQEAYSPKAKAPESHIQPQEADPSEIPLESAEPPIRKNPPLEVKRTILPDEQSIIPSILQETPSAVSSVPQDMSFTASSTPQETPFTASSTPQETPFTVSSAPQETPFTVSSAPQNTVSDNITFRTEPRPARKPLWPPLEPADRTENRTAVYDAVCNGVSIPDVIVSRLGLPIDDVLRALADLEILGYIRTMPGGNMVPNLK